MPANAPSWFALPAETSSSTVRLAWFRTQRGDDPVDVVVAIPPPFIYAEPQSTAQRRSLYSIGSAAQRAIRRRATMRPGRPAPRGPVAVAIMLAHGAIHRHCSFYARSVANADTGRADIPASAVCRNFMAIPSQRALFDVPRGHRVFQQRLSRAAIARLVPTAMAASSVPEARGTHRRELFEDAETVALVRRAQAGGVADGYAVVPAASYVSALRRAIEPQLKPGDAILVIAEEFPAACGCRGRGWRRKPVQPSSPCCSCRWKLDNGYSRAHRPQRPGRRSTLSHWTNGARGLICTCSAGIRRDVGCMLVVDASQLLGAAPFSIAQVKPDFPRRRRVLRCCVRMDSRC